MEGLAGRSNLAPGLAFVHATPIWRVRDVRAVYGSLESGITSRSHPGPRAVRETREEISGGATLEYRPDPRGSYGAALRLLPFFSRPDLFEYGRGDQA